MTTINDVWTAYDEGAEQWAGCNWQTHVGQLGLDLNGVSATQARRNAARWRAMAAGEAAWETTAGEESSLVGVARCIPLGGVVIGGSGSPAGRLRVCGHPARRFCAAILAQEWEFVSVWLRDVESDARWAGREAQAALAAAEEGEWEAALSHASQACRIESGYHAPQAWRKLRRVLMKATVSLGPFPTA